MHDTFQQVLIQRNVKCLCLTPIGRLAHESFIQMAGAEEAGRVLAANFVASAEIVLISRQTETADLSHSGQVPWTG